MMKDITHIALDMGGVVLHIDHEQAVSRFEGIGVAEAENRMHTIKAVMVATLGD